jgi:hypothetical protein
MQWVPDYSDTDVAFYMRAIRSERPLAIRALTFVRNSFPRSKVFLVSDGDYDAGWTDLIDDFGLELWITPRLYNPAFGARIVAFQLDLWRQVGTRWFVKIDPDTIVWRRPSHLPVPPGTWGTLQSAGGLFSVQGGCVIHSGVDELSALAPVLRRKEIISAPLGTWVRADTVRDRLAAGVVSDDWIRGWAMTKAGLQQEHHPEVRSSWKDEPMPTAEIAISHPHKKLSSPEMIARLRAGCDPNRSILRLLENATE